MTLFAGEGARAVDLNRNPGAIPSFAKSAGAWTSGYVLTADASGNTATFVAAGAGSGDVTDVGPGCATGACWKDGTATSGSSLLIWEGTTADTAEFTITVPTDPSADITWTVPNSAASITFPSGTRTLATLDGTETLTNKSLDASSIASGTLGASRGGTGIGSYTQGDLLVATGASNMTTIAKSITATRYLANTGASNYPQWDQVNLTNGVTGTLPAGNGGTGQTATTDDSLLVANGTTFQLKTLTDCDDTSGQHLNYDTTTNAFSCGTTSSGGGGGGAPTAAQYVTLALDGTLSAERVLTAGSQIDISDTGANGTAVIDWDSTELGTTTFGSGSGIVWTFDASAGTDPAITFGNGTVNVSTGALQQGGSTVVDVGDSGTVTGTMILDNTVNASDIDETTNYTWTGTHDFSGGLATLPSRLSACTSVVTNGQVCWDSDDFVASIGNGTGRAVLVDTGRTISTTSPLSGGGDLSANRTLSITANGINATQIDETANYAWSGLNTQTSGSLNFGNAAGALILPNNTTGVCDTATTEAQVCWSTSDLLKVGTGAAVKTFVDTDSTQTISNKSVNDSSSATSGAVNGFASTVEGTATSGTTSLRGLAGIANASPASGTFSGAYGMYGQADSNDAGTVTSITGTNGIASLSGSGNVTSAYGLSSWVLEIGSGTITNGYGLYIADSSGTITNDWAIYTAGSEKSRVGGSLGVGGDPTARLHVNAAASGDEVARFETTTTGADPRYSIYNFRGTTSGAASTTFDLPTTSDRTYVVEFVVGALCTNAGGGCTTGQAGGWISRAVYKNVAGTLTEVNETNDYAQDDITGAITTPAVAVSGTNIRLTCTGLASQTNTWVVTWKVQEMGA